MILPSRPRRLRFLLNPMGTAGDVHPYLGIATEMMVRGHEVFLLTNPSFKQVAARAGVSFVAIGDEVDWRKVAQDKKVHHSTSAWKEAMGWAAINPMREVYDHIARLNIPKMTCLVSPVWSFASRIAHESLGIPHVNCVVNPIVFRSAYDSPRIPMMYLPPWMPRWLKRYQFWWADKLFIDPALSSATNVFRKELGLKPVRRIMHRWWFSPELVLGLFDRSMVPPQLDWPQNVQIVGHPRWDPPGESGSTSAAVEFAKDGTPPVLFVPGSVGPGGSEFFASALDAVVKLGHRAIFLDRNTKFVPQNLPESIRHFQYVPLGELAQHCAAIVHCGCAGTLNHALAAGIPHVVWPRVNDQFDNAHRLTRLGLGVRVAGTKFSSSAAIVALRQLFECPKFTEKARAYASEIHAAEPLKDICNRLEALMKTASTTFISSGSPEELAASDLDAAKLKFNSRSPQVR